MPATQTQGRSLGHIQRGSYGAEHSKPATEYTFYLLGEPGAEGPTMELEGHAG